MHNAAYSSWRGDDSDSQYRSAVFCTDAEQLRIAQAVKESIEKKSAKRLSTQIVSLNKFWAAEDYHQKYYDKRMGLLPR